MTMTNTSTPAIAPLSTAELDKLKIKAERGEYITRFDQLGIIAQARLAAQPVGTQRELPPMLSNVAHVTRRIRRCESDTPAQLVLEHFARGYARAALAAPVAAQADTTEPAAGVTATNAGKVAWKIRGKYNWKGQPERLVYLGRNWSGNGYWHQFEKVDAPGIIWCEVLDGDLSNFEETKTATSAGEADTTASVSGEARVDEIVTALYRRFKGWSKRGFGPDDVTWCEVKADVLALIAAAAPVSQAVEQPADDAEDARIREALNTLLWLYRRLPQAYGNPPFVDKAIMTFADVLGIDAPEAIKERAAISATKQEGGK